MLVRVSYRIGLKVFLCFILVILVTYSLLITATLCHYADKMQFYRQWKNELLDENNSLEDKLIELMGIEYFEWRHRELIDIGDMVIIQKDLPVSEELLYNSKGLIGQIAKQLSKNTFVVHIPHHAMLIVQTKDMIKYSLK